MNLNWDKVFWWSMTLFSAFILYQIIRRIVGGSWEVEIILLTLTSVVLGLCFRNTRDIASIKSDYKHFYHSHQSLAKDFKEFRKETRENFSKLSHLMK